MSIWREYRRVRESLSLGDDPAAKFDFEDAADDHEHVQVELFKAALSKYPGETMDFLNSLANRGDEEISSLLRRVRKDKGPALPKEPRHPSDGHEIVPSSADRGHDSNSEE